ncbi:preprotein translocase subunit SecG [Pararcticibacter amylolyticus]|uniref:Protein-export membrane protein SecG n=1 Tax=Pararcticibacter amylolyticus TaxID=2173175 RepID=A0A2U2PAZ4_9SPHI|nr:preprotein translocase subunit SecG [Pararcticibacter amylolyticus]PWG78289.1 preprotein translocase subunit SecG [Pararcticibacter amylolyticus]
MFYALIILAIIICVLLAFLVLIQEPKGGGLTSGFAGSNNIMGVQRTGDFLEKGTWTLIISLMVIVLLINIVIPKGGQKNSEAEEIQRQINKAVPTAPAAPATIPGLKDTTKK